MEKDLPKGLPKPKMITFCMFFKGLSNDAHRPITALQMAFSPHSVFTEASVMKPFWKSVTGSGEEAGSCFHLIQLCPSPRGKEDGVMRRLPSPLLALRA